MSNYVTRKTPGNTEWFVHDRFGMFIHFGLYSLPARHEWIKNMERIPEEKYELYYKHFNPDLFDAKEWAKAAKNAGMKYAVITTKHHEGFCLFDSAYTDYKITNTQFGRDLIKEYTDALRAEGLKVGFYYSLLDWHHPHYTIDHIHPRFHDADAAKQDEGRDMKKYTEYMRNQVRELLTNYGKIDILWFDFSFEPREHEEWLQNGGRKSRDEWEADRMIEMVRSVQPDIIINNRLDIDQDLWTPEQIQPDEWVRHEKTGELLTWEACQTFSGSWGYFRDEYSWKSPEMLINMLVNTVSCGGNLIMNVGPTSRGYFDHRATDALSVYGEWMKYNSRSIYGCTMAEPEFTAPNGTKLTQSQDGGRIYVHLQTYPFGRMTMKNLAGKIEYAQFLCDGSEVLFTKKGNGEVDFSLPVIPPHGICPVIEIIFKL